ncbi:MAG: MBL fold metallo-hydrolase [bacterium]|nr:MAG: MBL fold metallo-hydrolase [bacterium]
MPCRIHSISVRMARAYLVEFDRGCFLIDTGAPRSERRVLECMRRLGCDDLRLIFITHAHLDHYGSAASLRRLTGAPIAVHRNDARAMAEGRTSVGTARSIGRFKKPFFPIVFPFISPEPTAPDILVDDGDTLRDCGCDATVIHTPGHTPGSSCLLVDGRCAFVGDLLTTTWGPQVQRNYATDWSQLAGSLERLKSLSPEIIYPGHGKCTVDAAGLAVLRF